MSDRVIVGIKQGSLRGRKVSTKSGLHYYSFQGIPYAKPPVGNLRFQAPQPADAWPGIRDALVEGAVCPQLDDLQGCFYKGDEDCLFLNVYTCQLPSSGLSDYKAVMVWFHGGGFGFGSGNTDFYGPDYLLEGGVVLVTVNYRLGPLGFLSLPDAGVPGNAGLKDQVMALRWVQQNIKQFGGDPDKVTIFGASAGAASVQYHMLSPMSAGLFHRAIMQGGSAVNPWAYDDPPTARKKAFRLGEMLGLKTANSKELLEFLQSLSAKEILTGLHKGLTDEDTLLLTLYSVPTRDNENYGEVFLPDSPQSLLARGKFSDVTLIAGISSHEGMLMLNALLKKPHLLTFVDSNFHLLLPKPLTVADRANATKEIIQKVKHFYFGNKVLSKETLSNYVQLTSDVQFANGINYTIKQHVAFCRSPVFYYHFAFEGNRGLLKNILGLKDLSGTCHGDEGGYLFNPSVLDVAMDPESPEAKMSQRLVKLWTNFAKTGNPTPGPDHMLVVIWKPATTSELVYLNIDKELSMRHNLRSESISFWEEINKTTPEQCD